MPHVARRGFVQGVGLGALAFTVGGVEVVLTPAEARAQRVPFHILKADEVAALDALGETLAIGAREAGISHFVDQQLSVEPAYALLSIRITETRPPYLNFYRAALTGVDRASQAQHKMSFTQAGDMAAEVTVEFDTSTQTLSALQAAAYRAIGFATCKIDKIHTRYACQSFGPDRER